MEKNQKNLKLFWLKMSLEFSKTDFEIKIIDFVVKIDDFDPEAKDFVGRSYCLQNPSCKLVLKTCLEQAKLM